MEPIRFVFGLHLHQPVGNFDFVFEQHVRDVYRPLVEHLGRGGFWPAVLHISGPLLEWLEGHDTSYLDELGRLVADGKIELLLAGFYEPVLASLLRADRMEQIGWMREVIRRRFGADARGLWLTERVWEPELAADLADAGVRYALVDDRHFLVTGFSAERLHQPYLTESDGKRVTLFPIDERLRYLIPFRPPEETADYLRELRGAGHRLAVLADDGEKFGGWPGTKEWVYDRGWLARFMETIGGLVANGEVRLSTLEAALAEVPSGGLAYLPTASYREMESWSLPPEPALRLARLERDLGPERIAGPDGALVRGGHWRNFLARYPESNRMHKKAMALSALCRERDDPPDARRAIGRAQCNDAYWHGVFGGLYLPHLRDAVWRELAAAEAELRAGEPIGWEVIDVDCDGHDELRIHSGSFAAVIGLRRGAALEELTRFASGVNHANTLTRRHEAYHDLALENAGAGYDAGGGTVSIHDIEAGIRLGERPPEDAEDRALLVDRVLPGDLGLDAYARGGYPTVHSWARTPYRAEARRHGTALEVACRPLDPASGAPEKRFRFEKGGEVSVAYRWDPAVGGEGDRFAVECSIAGTLAIETKPEAERWEFAIETVAKSERGLDRTRQGESVTVMWPVSAGAGKIVLHG